MASATDKINATDTALATVRQQEPVEKPRQAAASIKPFTQGKVDRSAVPTNVVEPTWKDVVDIINPLQQIPIVGDVYRGITGEKISGLARSIGGFLYGGISGGFAAAIAAAYTESTGERAPGEQLVAMLMGKDGKTPASTDSSVQVAELTPPAAATAKDAAKTTDAAAQPAAMAAAASAVQPAAAKAGEPIFVASLPKGQAIAAASPEAAARVAAGIPLRERLNHKQVSSVTAQARPLETTLAGYGVGDGALANSALTKTANAKNFIGQLPPNAAAATAAQSQNLQLLQGFAEPDVQAAVNTLPTALAADAQPGTSIAAAATAHHNPLPMDLVQDMMMQGLDKYHTMKGASSAAMSGADIQ